jgi:1-acyl-sn-glycerol-3-phosphate acyltransferase
VTKADAAWAVGRIYMGWPTRLTTRARSYGGERVPAVGGVVYAINHLHWVDIPLVGALSPRTVWFVAKAEAADHPVIGWFLRLHGTISIRRGESDRDAVRRMRDAARRGEVVGLFVEGTRQRSGRPGTAQPGAAMVALQEDVPVVPVAVYGTQRWRLGNFAPCSVAFGSPLRFDGVPRGGRGYKEATAEIERRINVLFDWLAGVHRDGRPRGLTPPI